MKLKLLLCFALALIYILLESLQASIALAAETPATTLFNSTGLNVPEPPRQNSPWKPPTTDLSTTLISSTRFLFDLGLPDPRGCDYREFETITGSRWDSGSTNKAHGWILPAQPSQKERFAIGWNGLVYPAIRIGARADLKQDVNALLKAELLQRKEAATNMFFLLWPPWGELSSEDSSLSETNVTAVKVLFLLRLGKGKLAQEYWAGWYALTASNEMKEDRDDPFHSLAYDWAATLLERAMRAHMAGDDGLALADCRELTRIRPELERETGRRGFSHPLGTDTSGQTEPIPYFDFLQPVPDLLADEERRLAEPSHKSALEIGLNRFADKSKRIAALISNLDEIAIASFVDQFGMGIDQNPTMKALIAQGEDAVEPLIDCMEHDKRLTRSADFGQSFAKVDKLVPVRDDARAALDGILMMHFDTAAEYRAYWQKYKSLPQLERWYGELRDDRAGEKQWMQAADNILSRTDGKHTYLWRYAPAPNATNDYTYVAESLRSKANPSVSDLLGKRVLEIAPTNYLSSEDSWAFGDATRLALMLAEWDPKGAVPVLKKTIPHCPLFYVSPGEDWDSSEAEEDLATLAIALAQLGNNFGLDIYAKWLDSQSVSNIENVDGNYNAAPVVLSPLGRFPNYPPIREVSAKLFQKGQADWLNGTPWGYDLLQTHLIRNEAFRALVLQCLTNDDQCGTITLKQGGQFDAKDARESFGGTCERDAFAPKFGQVVSFRICDDIAWRLSRIENLPHFELYWPQAKRDAALANIIDFLKVNGDDLKLETPSWPPDDN